MKNSKRAILITIFLVSIFCLTAQDMDWAWASGAGGVENDSGWYITADDGGNQYVTGFFMNSANFGNTTLTSFGGRDIYIGKIDPDGNWLWIVQAGGTGYDHAYGIEADSDGNIYVVGEFASTAAFGTINLTSAGGSDAFVAKLDSDGNWIWAIQAGGASDDMGIAIIPDNLGNVFAQGAFQGSATFGIINLTSSGSNDIFIAKLNSEGNWLWVDRAGGTGDDFYSFQGIALDSSLNVYITGCFEGVANFGSITLTNAGVIDIYVAKLDSDGYWLWAVRAGGVSGDVGESVGVDGEDNVYVTGYYMMSSNFGTHMLSSSGGTDIFVAKLDSHGNWLWAVRAGGVQGNDIAYHLILDDEANIYFSGCFVGTAYFGTTTLTGSGSYDIVVAKLDSTGNWLWAERAGGTGDDFGSGIGMDSSGNLYMSGEYEYIANFGSFNLVCNGGSDIVVAKLSPATGVDDDQIPTPGMSLSLYPNPFTPGSSLSIEGRLKAGERGLVSIYNQRGQLIRQFDISENLNTIHWDGLDSNNKACASGIYFCRLQTYSGSIVKKMVLIK